MSKCTRYLFVKEQDYAECNSGLCYYHPKAYTAFVLHTAQRRSDPHDEKLAATAAHAKIYVNGWMERLCAMDLAEMWGVGGREYFVICISRAAAALHVRASAMTKIILTRFHAKKVTCDEIYEIESHGYRAVRQRNEPKLRFRSEALPEIANYIPVLFSLK